MRIVFFGIPDMGVICLNALAESYRDDIIAIVPPIPSHQAYKLMISVAEFYKFPCVHFNNSPKEAYFIRKLKDLKPDIGIVCSFNHLIPKEVIDIFPMGIINTHPSLLPDYRGGNPYFHQLLNGETQSGITFHYMDSTFDTGDIIFQAPFSIDEGETFGTLFEKANNYSAMYVVELVKRLKEDFKFKRISQKLDGEFKKAPSVKIEKGHTAIKWRNPADYIEKFARACNPFYGAACVYKYKILKFWTAEYEMDKNYSAPAGTIVEINEDRLGIQTSDGIFYPTCLSYGFLINCNIKEFIRQFKPEKGDVFEEMQ